MFEAMAVLCTLAGGDCREAVLPGYAAETQKACAAALQAHPPEALASMADIAPGTPTCEPRPPSPLTVTEVAPDTFVHRGAVEEPGPGNGGDVANLAFVIGADSVAVIDAGGSRAEGEAIYLAIRARTEKPITHLILTHMHPDHVLGAAPLKEAGAEVIGREGLTRAMAEREGTYETNFARFIGQPGFLGTRMIAPDREVTEETLNIGGHVLTLSHQSLAHTATDLTVLDESTDVLFSGDLVFDSHTPTLDGSLLGWRKVLAELGAGPATSVVPGHGGPILPWPEGARDTDRYLSVLETDARAAITAGEPLSSASRTIGLGEAGNWRLFDAYNARNATAAYTELEWE
ncbi:MAG: quinoprotein relay system zinc metallohydrolase 2 [Rhodospirillum sp.]|nr:quinoprotein relay system zinc metallohydrolase 2 [Rhodospirillum sp.]MCF8489672.1 quinoprotein relay system zinc metallohydrolase 2 [Rhodospirillum sp.]